MIIVLGKNLVCFHRCTSLIPQLHRKAAFFGNTAGQNRGKRARQLLGRDICTALGRLKRCEIFKRVNSAIGAATARYFARNCKNLFCGAHKLRLNGVCIRLNLKSRKIRAAIRELQKIFHNSLRCINRKVDIQKHNACYKESNEQNEREISGGEVKLCHSCSAVTSAVASAFHCNG